MNHLLLLHIFSTIFMCGLIWVIQLVHYPSYIYIEEDRFEEFQKFHIKNITFIVAPIMLIELFTSFLLLAVDFNNSLLQINLISIILIWISTFCLSIPCHNKLTKKKNLMMIKRLVMTNWIRTILWSLRLIIIFKISLQ